MILFPPSIPLDILAADLNKSRIDMMDLVQLIISFQPSELLELIAQLIISFEPSELFELTSPRATWTSMWRFDLKSILKRKNGYRGEGRN